MIKDESRIANGGLIYWHGTSPLEKSQSGVTGCVRLSYNIDETGQFINMRIDIEALAFQQVNPPLTFLDGNQPLRMAAIANVIQVDHLAYVGKAEAHAFRAQDPGKAGAIPLGVNSGQPAPDGGNKAFILIETQRARAVISNSSDRSEIEY